MTADHDRSPDLPAELKAALDARLHGLSRNDAASAPRRSRRPIAAAATPSAIRSRDRRAGLCAGADARDLCRGHRQPERAARDQAGLCAGEPARCRRRAGHGDMGRGRSVRLAASISRCSMPTPRLRDAGARSCQRQPSPAQHRLSSMATPAPGWPKPSAADLVVASYVIGEIERGRATRARRADVGQNPRHAAGGRARHARGLRADHRAARAIDRGGRACRGALPA